MLYIDPPTTSYLIQTIAGLVITIGIIIFIGYIINKAINNDKK